MSGVSHVERCVYVVSFDLQSLSQDFLTANHGKRNTEHEETDIQWLKQGRGSGRIKASLARFLCNYKGLHKSQRRLCVTPLGLFTESSPS